MSARTHSTATAVRRANPDQERQCARTLGAMTRRLVGALGDANLSRQVAARTDPTGTRRDPHRLPMSRPRETRCDVAIHIDAATEHIRLALEALGIDWKDEPASAKRAA